MRCSYEAPQAVVGWRGEAHGRGHRAATNDEPPTSRDHRLYPRLHNVDGTPHDHDHRLLPEFATRSSGPASQTPRVSPSPERNTPREIPARTCIRKCRRVPRAVSNARPAPRARSAQRARMTGPSLTTIVPRRERFAREYRLPDRHRLVRCAKAQRTEAMRGASCCRALKCAIEEADVYGHAGRGRQRLLVGAGDVRRRRSSPTSAAVAAWSTGGASRRGVDRCLHARSARKVCTTVQPVQPVQPVPAWSSSWRSGGFLVLPTRNRSAPSARPITRISRALRYQGAGVTLCADGELAHARRDPGATECVRGCRWWRTRRRARRSGRRAR